MEKLELVQLLASYGIIANEVTIEPLGHGHIHKTFKLKVKTQLYVLQKFNTTVFTQPQVVWNNYSICLNHIQNHAPSFVFPLWIKTCNNQAFFIDQAHDHWRLMEYIPHSITYNTVVSSQMAFDAASKFAELSKILHNLPAHLLQETIPRFHDLSWRYAQFEQAIATTQVKYHIDTVKNYIDFKHLVSTYQDLMHCPKVPSRIVHNDTKINNVLFHETTGLVICPIDLDTLMPGSILYDMGDMYRTYIVNQNEESPNLQNLKLSKGKIEAIKTAYLQQWKGLMTVDEENNFHFAGMFMIYMIGLRFITDYLNGNIYFNTVYKDQNLVRAQNQMQLLQLFANEKHLFS